jgi:hypothetical protein
VVRRAGLEAGAVVLHRQVHGGGVGRQSDVDSPRAGMTDRVGERLLGDAVEAEGDLRRQRRLGVAQAETHRQRAPPPDLGAVIAERLGQAAPLQDRGVEMMAQAAQVLGRLRQAAADGFELEPLRIRLGKLPAHDPKLEGHGGEPLAKVVVELLGDPPPRLLLGGDQAPRDPAELGAARLQRRPADGETVLRLPPQADVGGTKEKGGQAAAWQAVARQIEGRGAQGHPKLATALVALAQEHLARFTLGARRQGGQVGVLLRKAEEVEGPAHRLGGGVAVKLFRRGAPGRDGAFEVRHDEGVVRVLEGPRAKRSIGKRAHMTVSPAFAAKSASSTRLPGPSLS